MEYPRAERDNQSWYSVPGAGSDVFISSRIRLARNLVQYPFPEVMSEEAEARSRDEIVEAFQKLQEPFTVVYLDRLAPAERTLLMEKQIVTGEFLRGKHKAVLLGPEERVTAMVNESDHLRLAGIASGLALQETWQEVDRIDSELESHLSYAASLEWGYLSSSLEDIGTGLKASVMMHLPGLVLDESIHEALKTTRELGFRVKGYPGDGDRSLADVYQISSGPSPGAGEVEIIEKLEMVARELADTERKARQMVLHDRRVMLEDRVFRAYGLMKHARSVTAREAIELLAQVRLGISLGLIPEVSLEKVTSLLFLTQTSHTRKIVQAKGDEIDKSLVDYTRARLIRKALGGL